MQQEGPRQGPGQAGERRPRHPPPQQGVKQVALEQDGDEIEVGRPQPCRQGPQQPPRGGHLLPPGRKGKAGVRQIVHQQPPHIVWQHPPEPPAYKGEVGGRLFADPQRKAREQQEQGHTKTRCLIEQKCKAESIDLVSGFVKKIGAAHMDDHNSQHSNDPKEINLWKSIHTPVLLTNTLRQCRLTLSLASACSISVQKNHP